ncbi:MAG: polysaccharide pyruvyl transferase family protein [Bacteroidota bacterium]
MMKILHIASFNGNFGDNASHLGLDNILTSILGKSNFNICRIEIRRFYKNYHLRDKLNFDDDFVNLANKHNLIIFGGGGFLDYWVHNSETGTTIDISNKRLEQIKTPILISSVGALPHKSVPPGNEDRFERFLNCFYQKENREIFLRNDGSFENLSFFLKDEIKNKLKTVVDNAFFYELDYNYKLKFEKEFILINTTEDQLYMKNYLLKSISEEEYLTQMAGFINYIINDTDKNIIFAPHIYQDFNAIDKLIKRVGTEYTRNRIGIAPFCSGNYGAHQLFNYYSSSILNVGMRFHANICGLILNNNTIGLAALDRVIHMYSSIGLENKYLKLDGKFENDLIEIFKKVSGDGNKNLNFNSKQTMNRFKADSLAQYKSFFSKI